MVQFEAGLTLTSFPPNDPTVLFVKTFHHLDHVDIWGHGFNVDRKGEFNDSFLIFKTAVEEKEKPKVRVHFLD